MVTPHGFGAFAYRSNKNIFTLQDIDKPSSSTISKVSRSQPISPHVL